MAGKGEERRRRKHAKKTSPPHKCDFYVYGDEKEKTFAKMSEILDGAGKNEKNFDQNGRKAKAVHRNEKTKPELCRSVQKHSWAFLTPRYERGKKTGLNPTIQNNTPLSIHGPAFFSAIRGNSSEIFSMLPNDERTLSLKMIALPADGETGVRKIAPSFYKQLPHWSAPWFAVFFCWFR